MKTPAGHVGMTVKEGPILVRIGSITAVRTVLTLTPKEAVGQKSARVVTRQFRRLVEPGLITITQASAETGKSTRTIYRWLEKGIVTGQKVQGIWYVLKKTLPSPKQPRR